MKPDRLLAQIMRGDVGNVALADLVRLVIAVDGGQAKHYQVRHVAALIRKYHLGEEVR